MDKEILNSDGSRNYQVNILLDNVKRLEKENARLKNGLKYYKRCLYKITSIANECTNSKMWDFEGV